MKTRRLTVENVSGAAITAYLMDLPIESGYCVVRRALVTKSIERMSRLIKQEAINAVGSRVSPTVDEIGLIPMLKTSRSYIVPRATPPYCSTLTLEQGARLLRAREGFISHSLLNLRWEMDQEEAMINDDAVQEFLGSLMFSSEERSCFLHNIFTRMFNSKGPPFGMFLNGPSRSGKSSFIEALSMILGGNTAMRTINLDDMTDNDRGKQALARVVEVPFVAMHDLKLGETNSC
eukprot:GHVR01151388.1.p1 GENE.GHVR01151388.1~~GHVR01151388.1.p1  ORF type:complete len:234 (+),score=18.52 GHVR01151388.1:730-1431(+)